MKLEQIGFYTLSDQRAQCSSEKSPMWRCEMILTGRCNFKCPYCRGITALSRPCGDMCPDTAKETLRLWINDGLKNIRFSGGEPTLYPYLNELVNLCRLGHVERIAISTNGSMPFEVYEQLITSGVNDFSISLDACCSSFGDKMAGVSNKWNTVVENIRKIARLTYVTVGVVLTEDNVSEIRPIVEFASSLGVADIRIISAAQYNELLTLRDISQNILDKHPILKYRVNNLSKGRNVRGIKHDDTDRCYLVLDDSVVAGQWHFPCVIHMREGGEPIGKIGPQMRQERLSWHQSHKTLLDPICQKNCLDVCVDYNNKCHQCRNNPH